MADLEGLLVTICIAVPVFIVIMIALWAIFKFSKNEKLKGIVKIVRFAVLVLVLAVIGYQLVQSSQYDDGLTATQKTGSQEIKASGLSPSPLTVIKETRFDFSNVKRIQLDVKVPYRINADTIRDQVWRLCQTYFSNGEHAIAVHVYLQSDEIKGHNWYAMYHFAPGGDWGKAAAGVPFSDYRLSVEFNTEDMRKL